MGQWGGYSSYFDEVGEVNNNWITINWGDGVSESFKIKTLSVDTNSDSTIAEMGTGTSSSWTTGATHSYANNGTYIISWSSAARITGIKNITNSIKKSQKYQNDLKHNDDIQNKMDNQKNELVRIDLDIRNSQNDLQQFVGKKVALETKKEDILKLSLEKLVLYLYICPRAPQEI